MEEGDLAEKFKIFETEYLLELLSGELTESAQKIARIELISRGLTENRIDALVLGCKNNKKINSIGRISYKFKKYFVSGFREIFMVFCGLQKIVSNFDYSTYEFKYVSKELLNFSRYVHLKSKPYIYSAHWLLFFLSLALFFLCLSRDGYYVAIGHKADSALALLLVGWLGFIDGVFSWFANPFLLLAWVQFIRGKYSYAILFSIIAVVLIVTFQLHESIIVDEGGARSKIIGYGSGYWLWLSSSIVSFVASIFAIFSIEAKENT